MYTMTKKFLENAREHSADSSYGEIKLNEDGTLIATVNMAMEKAGSADNGIEFLTSELAKQSITINDAIINSYKQTQWQEVSSF